ncbi:MAG: UDP-N-acetylmuramoyl-L-alanine--D-glutamate ligase [Planctomycetota bacterium]|jgi:UDP-N-acetylmuramoylalanine--D-glutamate ligase
MEKEFFKDKKVLVVGLGRFGGGVDAAMFANACGAEVTVTDVLPDNKLRESIEQLKSLYEVEYHLGFHLEEDFINADIVIVNPAVNPDNKFLEIARDHNKAITSQVEIFFQLCPAKIIGITGANGKSTTAALTAHLLKAGIGQEGTGYNKVWLSGNIGNEPMLTFLDNISSDDLVVLELSSFQLEQLAQIQKAPFLSLITNLTPNHLDRHGTFENYCAAKENIFKYQKLDEEKPAVSIFNAEDTIASEWFEKYSSQQGRLCLKYSSDDVSGDIAESFKLPGRANLSNLAAAVAVVDYFGVDINAVRTALPEFKALAHRLELVAEINGVKWYNDSISTTPVSSIAALDAFEEPKIIIAGGYDKNLAFDELGKVIAQKTKAAILIGDTARKIADAINSATEDTENSEKSIKVEIAHSLEEAVELANKTAVAGDVVLLSPACASYDMFDNFQHRGREFVKLAQQLQK